MSTLTAECPRCGEVLSKQLPRCPICGGGNSEWDTGSPEIGRIAADMRTRVSPVIRPWTQRYGVVPLLALLGILPLYPVTPLLGILAGAYALHRIRRGLAPRAGRPLAIVGFISGWLWMVAGIMLLGRAATFVQSAPYIPAPLKWFWTWSVGG